MTLFYENNEDDQNLKELKQCYRNVFGSAEGRKVLGDIMVMCHFGVPLDSEKKMHEYNIGIVIARMSGMMSEVDTLLGIKE